LNNRH
jgi:hypothetical protein